MITNLEDEQHSPIKGLALVADDDPTMREIIAAFLSRAGYKVLQAASGSEAVSVVKDLNFSIAFIDLAMPNGNGLQTCAALRLAPGWHDVPIIVLTAYSIEMAMKASMDAGASGFLCKPLDPSELQWCLENYESKASHVASAGFDDLRLADRTSRLSADILDTSEQSLPPFDSRWTLSFVPPDLSGSKTSDPVIEAAGPPVGAMMVDLDRVTRFFAPDVVAGFLQKISASVAEILLLIETRGTASSRAVLEIALHNLCGTAGTIGLTALSTMARELLNDHSGSYRITNEFVDIANRTLDAIEVYTRRPDLKSHNAAPNVVE